MAKYDFIRSLEDLDKFIAAESNESGNISTYSFAKLCGVYPRYFDYDLLDIRSGLASFLSDRGIVAYDVFDNGMTVSELYIFLSYYARDGKEGFTHVTNRNGYARAKVILGLPKIREHLAKNRP